MDDPASFEITLLTQSDCSFCDHAKETLQRVAADVPITVREVALGTDEGRSLATRAGVLFPPGVFVNGETFSYGRLSERKLRKALGRRAVRPGSPSGPS